MPEAAFWRTMNPARLHALFDARFGLTAQRSDPSPQRSLSEYLRGGG